MQTSGTSARSLVLIAACVGGVAAAAPPPMAPDVATVLAHVGERVAEYYKRVQNIVCNEKSIVQPVSSSMGTLPGVFARVTESELRIESARDGEDGTPKEATFVRTLIKVNGRAPREKDKTDAASCMDPNPLTPEPLAFLLPAKQGEYRFSFAGFGKGKESGSMMIDYLQPATAKEGKLVEDPKGRDNCFSVEVPGAIKGRVWVDATTFDVLRVEEHLAGPGSVRVTDQQQRKHMLPDFITIDRYSRTIRLKQAAFKDPDETMLLPESIEMLIVYRNALESTRREQRFTDYRRFLTGGRIVK
ncbi:MAG TPA: hypothetical protein VFA27_05840 [Vicinamibacterales bacterium]|nr:hypothetical protein [Vicinamibacterales bacterium]